MAAWYVVGYADAGCEVGSVQRRESEGAGAHIVCCVGETERSAGTGPMGEFGRSYSGGSEQVIQVVVPICQRSVYHVGPDTVHAVTKSKTGLSCSRVRQ